MGTTYSTSSGCARAGGMKAQTATTNPDTTMIDDYRDDAYREIGRVVGYGATDLNSVLKSWERKLVGRRIRALIKGETYIDWELTPEEELRLQSDYSGAGGDIDFGIEFFEPDLNS